MSTLINELRLFFIALQFLTRIPVPRWVGWEPAWLQQSLRHFPLVGMVVGGWAALVLALALLLWPPVVAAVLSVVASVWLTGAFHEDGLADTCDGLGGAVSREKALLIMKDSRIGTYGAAGLVLALLLKVSATAALVEVGATPIWALMAVVWAHAASRLAPALLIHRLAYAGDAEHAKAKPLATTIDNVGLFSAALIVAVLSAGLYALASLTPVMDAARLLHALAAALVAGLVTVALAARWLKRRLGGYTGDTLGAAQQVVELVCLLAWLAVLETSTRT